MENTKSFWADTVEYASRVKEFNPTDWVIYFLWCGLIFSLFFVTFGFIYFGYSQGVQFPAYVWNIPMGTFIFACAISFDTIGHRTVYKEELLKGEALIHHITIFAGITSVLALCAAYENPSFFRFPALVLIFLSVVYSLIDEAFHWRRYINIKSDRVEMWSHVFILVGHMIMIAAWWHWFDQGYPGVAETLALMPK